MLRPRTIAAAFVVLILLLPGFASFIGTTSASAPTNLTLNPVASYDTSGLSVNTYDVALVGGVLYSVHPSDGQGSTRILRHESNPNDFSTVCTVSNSNGYSLTYDGASWWTTSNNALKKVNPSGCTTQDLSFSGTASSPCFYNSFVDLDFYQGKLWVLRGSGTDACIFVVDPSNGQVQQTYSILSAGNQPQGLALDSTSGVVWLGFYGETFLKTLDLSNPTTVLQTISISPNTAPGLAVSGSTMWVGDVSNQKLAKFTLGAPPTNSAPTISRNGPANPYNANAGTQVTFHVISSDANGGSDLDHYEWTVDGGSPVTKPIGQDYLDYTFNAAGTYTVSATIYDKGGLHDSVSWTQG